MFRNAFLRIVLSFVLPLFATQAAKAASAEDRAAEKFVDRLMAKMTTAEKVAQLVQVSAGMATTGPGETPEFMKMIADGRVGSVLNSYSLEMMIQLQSLAVEKTRLKIPLLFAGDIVHGMYTKFPIPLAESSSWDLALIEKSARLAAVEAAGIGLDWTYAPMVDIARDPRWGRVVEGAGEDPWWGSQVSAARVRGFQGKKLTDPDTLMSCAKHFAGYGAAIAGRDYNSVELSEREMREVYLPPFKAAVEAGVSTLMAAFNDISGIPSSANRWLLKTVLRDEWDFKGFVVSDYSSIRELIQHGVAADKREAAILAFKAGLDVDMEGGAYDEHLEDLARRDPLTMKRLDIAARKVLLAKYKRGLFSDPFRFMNEERFKASSMRPDMIEHALEIARKSIVLMKNDGTLPLAPVGTIALIGPLAEIEHGLPNDGTFPGIKRGPESLLSAMQKFAEGKFDLKVARGAKFSHYGKIQDARSEDELLAEAMEIARRSDVIVLSIGDSPDQIGEAASRTMLRIPASQRRLLAALKTLEKPIVTVLSNGRPMVIEEESQASNALLETWYLGMMAGQAIVDVLFGEENPSGKLTLTFPRNEGQIPIYYAVRNTGRPASEDMWSSKYLDSPNAPLYPFGWGLSYTAFAYSDLQVQPKKGNAFEVSVTLTNTGTRAGEEVAQLYVRDMVASVSRPIQLLRGFRKVRLEPGESRRLVFTLSEEDLKFYNHKMKWVSEPGLFKAMVGGNSVEVIMADFRLGQPLSRGNPKLGRAL